MDKEQDERSGPTKQSTGIQSVEIGMTVLDAFAAAPGAMTLKQVSEASGMSPSKAHRYLASFVRSGMLVQIGSHGLYDLGPTARRLGLAAMGRLDPFAVASNGLLRLRDITGHTVLLAVWTDNGPTLVRWESGREPLVLSIRIGSSLPLRGTSVGLTFLAYMPSSVTQPVLAAQQRLVGAGGPQRPLSSRELEKVRSSRSIHTESALIGGIDAIAAPVFDAPARLSSVIALLAPHRTLEGPKLGKVRHHVEAIAREISTELGCPPD